MFGDILGWMYNDLAGIQPDWKAPAFRTILISPHPVEALAWVRAEYNSRFGRILSAWKWRGRVLQMTDTIPPTTSALVTLPGAPYGSAVHCNGRPLASGTGGERRAVRLERSRDGMILRIGPGTYHISYRPRGLSG